MSDTTLSKEEKQYKRLTEEPGSTVGRGAGTADYPSVC